MSTDTNPGRGDGRPVVTPETLREIFVSMAEVLGHKWHLVILHHLLTRDAAGFNELKQEIGGISSKVLSDSLERLETRHGLVERHIVNEKPVRVEYSVTERGRELEPVVMGIRDWGLAHATAQ